MRRSSCFANVKEGRAVWWVPIREDAKGGWSQQSGTGSLPRALIGVAALLILVPLGLDTEVPHGFHSKWENVS